MSSEKKLSAYDDDDAIAFILKNISSDCQSFFEDDDIQYFLDLMYEMDEKFIVDEDELISKIIKESKKDGMDKFTAENITALLDAENKYSKSIGLFE
ncbi:MAG: hypothetical protein KBA02_01010 [Paludibacteraceae bacterium]|nr:hypothetical protein [Paludibacteraceae bacterium]